MMKSVGVILTAALVGAMGGSLFLKEGRAMEPRLALSTEDPSAQGEPRSADKADGYVARGPDGHYWAWAEMDDHPVRVLVDTGASAVALTPMDAKRAGVDLEKLVYNHPMNTAQGRTYAAAVTLDSVSVAGVRLDHVEAMVVPSGLSTSLLGMSYLGRLGGFDASPAGLTLHP